MNLNEIDRAASLFARRGISAVKLLLCAALATLLVACSATPVQQQKSQLEIRSQARWDALLAGNYGEAWKLYSPGYRSAHSVVDLEIAWRMRRVQTLAAEYDSHTCEEYLCTVQVSLTYKKVRPVTGLDEWVNTKIFPEKWLLAEDQWWYLPD